MVKQQKISLKHQLFFCILLSITTFFLPVPATVLPQTQKSHQVFAMKQQGWNISRLQAFAFSKTTPPTSKQTDIPTITPIITNLPTKAPTIVIPPTKTKTHQMVYPIEDGALEQFFSRYAREFNVDVALLKRIAYCESHYHSGAVNGPYAGLFQYSTSTWIKDRKLHGWNHDPNLRFNAEEAIKTAAAKIAKGGLGAWPKCGR